MNKTLNVVFVIIGTIIGAGFASGKEIEIFFIDYGIKGLIGMLLTSFLMAIIVTKILKIVDCKNIKNYENFLDEICNYKNKKVKYLKEIIKIIINIFLLVSFFAMTSGCSNYFKQEFDVPIVITNMLFILFCYFTLLKNINGIVRINRFLIPVIITYIIYIGTKNSVNINFAIEEAKQSNWCLSSIIYASYNSLVLVPVLIDLKKYYKNENNRGKISILLFTFFFIIMFEVFTILMNEKGINNIEIPMLFAVEKFRQFVQKFIRSNNCNINI